MVLFTKEVFVQLKILSSIYVHMSLFHNNSGAPIEMWGVQISGNVDVGTSGTYDNFSADVQAQTKEDAYRIYKELAQQVVQSGKVAEMNDKLFDDVLKGETP